MGYTILILNNSDEEIELLSILFADQGYNLIVSKSGREALEKIDDTIDLIVMDIGLKDENGFLICREIRAETNTPIIITSKDGGDSEKGVAFSAGADDFLTKPFSYNELSFRAKAHIRRYNVYVGKDTKADGSIIKVKNLVVDTSSEQACLNGEKIMLTSTEYNLLALMIKERKKIFTYEEIYEKIWNEPYFYKANNTIMVHILKLRRKIEADVKNPEIIKTAWGKGYYID